MLLNYYCFVLFVGFVLADVPELPKNVIINEIPCLTFGGACMPKSECPKDKTTKSSLCPVQESDGIQCCYSKNIKEALDSDDIDLTAWRNRPGVRQVGDIRGMPQFEMRCEYRGGVCKEKDSQCPDILTYREATDCTAEQKCCILVD